MYTVKCSGCGGLFDFQSYTIDSPCPGCGKDYHWAASYTRIPDEVMWRRGMKFLDAHQKGKTFKEIGEAVGISPGRVREIVYRAEFEARNYGHDEDYLTLHRARVNLRQPKKTFLILRRHDLTLRGSLVISDKELLEYEEIGPVTVSEIRKAQAYLSDQEEKDA